MKNNFEISNLSAGYHGQNIIHGLDLSEISPSSVVGIVGPNAAGKSTFLKSLAGLISYKGSAVFNGAELGSLSADSRLSQIGYLPQALPQASSLLAYECVLSACRVANMGRADGHRESKIEQLFEMLNLSDEAFRRVNELSGGKRQLVGLAQVLVREPGLMLLDEPTSALDLKWQIQVLEFVKAAVKEHQAIALVAAHDINLVMRFCDTLLVLSDGKLLAAGKPADVVTPEILHEAYGVEARVEHCSKGLPIVLADRVATEKLQGEQVEK